MLTLDEMLWNAIEGALGSEKRAFLQNAPLTEVLGGDATFALPHAIGGAIAMQQVKSAEAKSIESGLQALSMVAKEAELTVQEPFTQKVARAYKLRTLEPLLSGGEKQAAQQARRTLNLEIMETVKQAAAAGTALSGIIENPLLRDTAKKMLGGAAVAGGAALPAYAVGSHLSDKFTEDARNRALQTAGGVAGIGLLGYGAKTLMDQAAQDRTRDRNYAAMAEHFPTKMSGEKVAAEVYHALHMPQEKVAYLATAVYLDELLGSVEQTLKVASLRDLNREFLTELVATTVKMSTDAQSMFTLPNGQTMLGDPYEFIDLMESTPDAAPEYKQMAAELKRQFQSAGALPG